MKTAVKILCIIGIICGFWWILPIIFGLKVIKKINNNQPLTTGDKVCTLLFVSTVGGILSFFIKD